MKEIFDIIKSYDKAHSAGVNSVLATVVKVEGSSYRQPGARMLVTEFGEITGAISGGCLEGDALKRALVAMEQKQNKLITYDTSDPNNTEFAVQLGCNGIVHILFEYINPNAPTNAIALLKKVTSRRRDAVLGIGYNLDKTQKQEGHYLFHDSTENSFNELLETAYTKKQKIITDNLLADFIPKPPQIIIAGAGNDVQPLVNTAHILGWTIFVADGRASHTKTSRFPNAQGVIQTSAEDFLNHFQIDEQTYFVLMTHNYAYDLKLLKQLIETPTPYIGVLGPKTKMEKMIHEFPSTLTDKQHSKIYGPVGLDIGAETAEEIAISIISEIQAVIKKRNSGFLRHKIGKIH